MRLEEADKGIKIQRLNRTVTTPILQRVPCLRPAKDERVAIRIFEVIWIAGMSPNGPLTGVRAALGVISSAPTSSINTQSLSPSLFFPGGVNSCVTLLSNGEPGIFVKLPLVASYHLARVLPPIALRSTVAIRPFLIIRFFQ